MRASYNARGARNAPPRPMVAKGASIPAPIEGWDAVSPISQMSPRRAVRMDNWFPQPSWVEVRRGHITHVQFSTVEPVETLMAYQGVSSDKLFAVTGGEIFDVTASGAPPAADVTGLANSRFQFINFATTGGNFLYCVNGTDYRYYDGSSWATPTITGTGAADFIGINAFKNRIWLIKENSSTVYYLATDSIQGAATAFPLGGLFTMGGYVMAMGTWSVDAGDGPEDYAVFVSSRGQVAVYGGINPASDFALVGVFNLGAPIGRRCLTKVGADIAIISIDGVLPLSKAMIFERAAIQNAALTANIQRVMNQSARSYGDNFGWQLISYPKGTRAILNVPIAEGDEQHQYVMNTMSGAWCRFLGMNANCWELLNDRLFFGGNDGAVYEADVTGTDAHGAVLSADMMTAFNYFGVRGRQKRWMMCRPLITTDGRVAPGIAFNVDFREDAPISVPVTPSSVEALWDEALWDEAVWPGIIRTEVTWTSVAGLGYCASVRMQVDIEHPNQGDGALWGAGLWGISRWGEDVAGSVVTLQVNGFDVTMETGAMV